MGGGAGKKPTAGALLSWQGAEMNYSEAFDLLLQAHKILWTPHIKGNSCKVVGKGALAVKVVNPMMSSASMTSSRSSTEFAELFTLTTAQ
jgi:hypothetical protein